MILPKLYQKNRNNLFLYNLKNKQMFYIEEPKLINNLKDKDFDYFIFNKDTNIILLTKKMKNTIYKKIDKDRQYYKDIIFYKYNINIDDECHKDLKTDLMTKFDSLYGDIANNLSTFISVIKSKRYNSNEEEQESTGYYFSYGTFDVYHKDFIYTINKDEYDILVKSFLENIIEIGDSISEKFFVSKPETMEYLISEKITDVNDFYMKLRWLFLDELRKLMEEFINDKHGKYTPFSKLLEDNTGVIS